MLSDAKLKTKYWQRSSVKLSLHLQNVRQKCTNITHVLYLSLRLLFGIATAYGLEFQSRQGQKNFHSSISSRPALGSTQPSIQWIEGVLSPGVKRQGREADHSPLTCAEEKKTWIYTSTTAYAFMA
jgi:hypothetical protein